MYKHEIHSRRVSDKVGIERKGNVNNEGDASKMHGGDLERGHEEGWLWEVKVTAK